jgi:hypothetical protein
MKHHKRCSHTILESPLGDKWGEMANTWVNKVLFKTNEEQWLKLGQIKFYLKQNCA